MSEHVEAPFTLAQVHALRAWQNSGWVHPFTCPHDHPDGLQRDLIPYVDGWCCPLVTCDYRQTWAHAFMADESQHPANPFGGSHMKGNTQ